MRTGEETGQGGQAQEPNAAGIEEIGQGGQVQEPNATQTNEGHNVETQNNSGEDCIHVRPAIRRSARSNARRQNFTSQRGVTEQPQPTNVTGQLNYYFGISVRDIPG